MFQRKVYCEAVSDRSSSVGPSTTAPRDPTLEVSSPNPLSSVHLEPPIVRTFWCGLVELRWSQPFSNTRHELAQQAWCTGLVCLGPRLASTPPPPPRGQSTVPAPLILSFPRLAKQCPKYTPRRPPRLSLSPCPQCQLWSQHPTNFTVLLLAATVPPFSLPFSGRRKQQHRSWTGPAQPTMLPRSSAAAPWCKSRRHSYAPALV